MHIKSLDNQFDIIVIGAGVAGGVFACSQKNSGKKILVIERTFAEQDRIVGELLQPGGLAALRQLELEHLTEGFGAQRVEGYTLVNEKEHFSVAYTEIQEQSHGLGLRNGKFLLNIQEELRQQKNVTLLEASALNLLEENGRVVGVEYQLASSNELFQVKAPLTVISDGPMSRFREKISEVKKEVNGYFVGLVLRNINPIQVASGHVVVSGKSPVLIYPIAENEWRILVDFPGEKAPGMGEKMKQYLKDEIYGLLPLGMKQAFLDAIEGGDIKVMPNHRMKARVFKKEGAVLLGDSLNMRHPLTGGGMTATFMDIISLNKSLENCKIQNSESCSKALVNYYKTRNKEVESINILANALYKVVCDNDLKVAVFNYLKRGGNSAKGPLSLLSGLKRDKQALLMHFFKVAMQYPGDFILKPAKQIRTLNKAVGIIYPLLKDELKPSVL